MRTPHAPGVTHPPHTHSVLHLTAHHPHQATRRTTTPKSWAPLVVIPLGRRSWEQGTPLAPQLPGAAAVVNAGCGASSSKRATATRHIATLKSWAPLEVIPPERRSREQGHPLVPPFLGAAAGHHTGRGATKSWAPVPLSLRPGVRGESAKAYVTSRAGLPDRLGVRTLTRPGTRDRSGARTYQLPCAGPAYIAAPWPSLGRGASKSWAPRTSLVARRPRKHDSFPVLRLPSAAARTPYSSRRSTLPARTRPLAKAHLVTQHHDASVRAQCLTDKSRPATNALGAVRGSVQQLSDRLRLKTASAAAAHPRQSRRRSFATEDGDGRVHSGGVPCRQ